MKKRLFSFLLVLICVCSFSLSAFAKSIDDITADDAAQITANPYLWYAQNQMLGVEKGTGVTLVCPNGDYKTLYTGGTLVTCPYDGEALELASAGGVTAKKIPEGIGRKDIIGYQDNSGTPNVSCLGELHLSVQPYGLIQWHILWNSKYPTGFCSELPNSYYCTTILSSSGSATKSESKTSIYVPLFVWSFTAPEDGIYYVGKSVSFVESGTYSCYLSNKWNTQSFDFSGYSNSDRYYSCTLKKGERGYFFQAGDRSDASYPFKYTILPITILYEPLGDSELLKQTNVTINSNTWNGNIYVDNSNNLTYIYPEYTTINENNETVTNISTNPIIYNNETKQYYTYDSVTQNYYYITYNENPATPTPSPSPTPSPDNPSGGGSGSGGSGSGSGNNGGSGSSWNPFKWLTDLLKDIVETILKGLWKLLTSIFGFILWLLSLLFKLFPWMPNSGILALCAGVVVVTVIRIIKFITGR